MLGLPILGGAVTATSPVPLEWNSGGFLGPILLFLAIDGPKRRPTAGRAFLAGFLFSTTVNALSLYWIVGLLMRFASFPLVAALPVALLLWGAQALPAGLAAAGAAVLTRRAAERGAASLRLSIFLPSCVVVATTLAPSLFPWRVGHSQLAWLPFAQIADLGGEAFLDFATWLVAAAAYEALRNRLRPKYLLLTGVLLGAPWAYGEVRLHEVEAIRGAAPMLQVGVIQPNLSIERKRDRRLRYAHLIQLRSAGKELARDGADVVIWPESAYPFGIARSQSSDFSDFRALQDPNHRVPLLAGAVTWGPPDQSSGNERWNTQRRYNSVVAVNREGQFVGIADKVELLAFGEFTPFWDQLPILRRYFPRGLTPGKKARVLELDDVRYGVLNCYEDVLSAYGLTVARHNPDLLVNVTNDAWFGDTTEPWLHQMVARLRAIETRRDLVRAVNTGVSSHISATGETLFRTETGEETQFLVPVRKLQGKTLWTRFGDWLTPTLAVALLMAAIAFRPRRQRR